jgi:hypothetical protein
MAVRWIVALGAATFSSLAGHLPPFRTDKIARPWAMLNSSMEASLPSRGLLKRPRVSVSCFGLLVALECPDQLLTKVTK